MSKKPVPVSTGTTIYKDKFFDLSRGKKLESAFDTYEDLNNFNYYS